MKFGIVISKDATRKTLPQIEASSEDEAVSVALDENPGWEISLVEAEPFWWNNCLYNGQATGHSHGFCTAGACY